MLPREVPLLAYGGKRQLFQQTQLDAWSVFIPDYRRVAEQRIAVINFDFISTWISFIHKGNTILLCFISQARKSRKELLKYFIWSIP